MKNVIDFLNKFVGSILNGDIKKQFDTERSVYFIKECVSFFPSHGICGLLGGLNDEYKVEFKNFLISDGLDYEFPVGGYEEYAGNQILWWDDDNTNSHPMWKERIQLLKKFIEHLENKDMPK